MVLLYTEGLLLNGMSLYLKYSESMTEYLSFLMYKFTSACFILPQEYIEDLKRLLKKGQCYTKISENYTFCFEFETHLMT